MSKVEVISNTDGEVSINIPELKFHREWPSKGTKIKIEEEVLEELIYYNGVNYMFRHGMLYIDDMDVKKRIGLEPEEAEEPVNVVILSDEQKDKMLMTLPYHLFEKEFPKLAPEEQMNLADYAISKEVNISFDKCDLIKKTINRDIIRAIQLNRAEKEEVNIEEE